MAFSYAPRLTDWPGKLCHRPKRCSWTPA